MEASILDDTRKILSILRKKGFDIVLEKSVASSLKKEGTPLRKMDIDVFVVLGSDSFLLKTLQELGNSDTPILPIASKGQDDFLFDVSASEFDTIVSDLVEEKWTQDRHTRLTANIQGKDITPVLNEIGIFCKRSATLLRYSLSLNDEVFWKDGSDGLIIATPTGSTAYSMSVGGPVVLHPSEVFSIIPVNSVNPSRRTLIVPSNMIIEISDLSSSVSIEVILDGQKRVKAGDSPIVIKKSDADAIFVKFDEERLSALRGKLQRKTENSEQLQHGLPPSAKLILKVLEYNDQLTQKQIIEESMLPSRTVRYALSLLISEGLIQKHTSLRDSRQALYSHKRVPRKKKEN